jgi:hypothetical protein
MKITIELFAADLKVVLEEHAQLIFQRLTGSNHAMHRIELHGLETITASTDIDTITETKATTTRHRGGRPPLSPDRAAAIRTALAAGNGIRKTAHMLHASSKTVARIKKDMLGIRAMAS